MLPIYTSSLLLFLKSITNVKFILQLLLFDVLYSLIIK